MPTSSVAGNFIADIMMSATKSDVTLLNSGTLRSDRIHHAGDFTLKDMLEILPFPDSICVLAMTAHDVMLSLEAAVSKYPEHEGRFLQVAGLKFAFDPKRPVGERVCASDVTIDGEALDDNKVPYCSIFTSILLM